MSVNTPSSDTPAARLQDLDEGRWYEQRCTSCDASVWQPRTRCPECLADSLVWAPVRRAVGRVRSLAVVHKPHDQVRFGDEVPITLLLVERYGGPQVIAVGSGPQQRWSIGDRVRLELRRPFRHGLLVPVAFANSNTEDHTIAEDQL